MASKIRIRRRFDGQSILGKVAFVAPEGLLVNFDGTDLATPSLAKVTGKKGFALARPVVTQATLEAQLIENHAFPEAVPIKNGALVNDHVSASAIAEAELEGPDYVLTSGTGLINAGTAVDTKLTTNAGRLSVVQGSEEVVGYLRGHLTPEDSGNTTRILVQYVHP